MNETTLNKQRVLNCKTPIVVLALIALVCAILAFIQSFTAYGYTFTNGHYVAKLFFYFPPFLRLISALLTLAPYILLILYVFNVIKGFKSAIIVPIIFACIAVGHLFSLTTTLGNKDNFLTHVLNLITAISFALATISALNGLSNKIFIIISSALQLIMRVISLIGLIVFPYAMERYVERDMTLYLITHLASIIAPIFLNVALLLFGLKNNIPVILRKEKANAEQITPEQALKLLKEKLDLGMITEEEYQAQRADIISKL